MKVKKRREVVSAPEGRRSQVFEGERGEVTGEDLRPQGKIKLTFERGMFFLRIK